MDRDGFRGVFPSVPLSLFPRRIPLADCELMRTGRPVRRIAER